MNEVNPKHRRYWQIAMWIGLSLASGVGGHFVHYGLDRARWHWIGKEKMLLFLQSESGDRRIAKLMVRYSETYELDPLFLAAVVWRESSFKPGASSERGAKKIDAGGLDRGLGGMSEAAAKELLKDYLHYAKEYRRVAGAASRLYEIDLNLELTAANLRRILDEHPVTYDQFDAYSWYNSGDEGKGSLQNVMAVKQRYHIYAKRLREFDWRKAR